MLKWASTTIEGWHEWSIIDKKKLYYSPSYSVWEHYKSLDVMDTKKNKSIEDLTSEVRAGAGAGELSM